MKNTMNGNRVLLKLQGQVVGGGTQSVAVHDDYGIQDVDGLGNAETQELVYGKAQYTINLSRYFVYNQKLSDILGTDSASLFPKIVDGILESPEWSLEILDKTSLRTLELYHGCKFASGSRNYGKHTLSGEDAVIRARSKEV